MFKADVSQEVRTKSCTKHKFHFLQNELYDNLFFLLQFFLTDHVSIGALADSYYEYLLKASIQLQDAEARQLYDDAMDGFVNNSLVKISKPSHLLYIAESRDDRVDDIVGHLACFAGTN